MRCTGVEAWIPLVIKPLNPLTAVTVERWHIISHKPNLNAIHNRKPTKLFHRNMRWMIRSGLHRMLPTSALADAEVWKKCIQAKALTIHPMQSRQMLKAAKHSMQPAAYGMLRSRLLTYVNTQTGLQLPQQLTIRVPYCTERLSTKLKKAWSRFLHTVPYPRPIRQYLTEDLHVPLTIPRTVKQGFTTDRVTLSMATMSDIIANLMAHCACPQTTNVQVCTQRVYHDPSRRAQLFSHMHTTVFTSMLNQTLIPSTTAMRRQVHTELCAVRRSVPKKTPFKFPSFTAEVHTMTQDELRTIRQAYPDGPKEGQVRAFQRD